MNGSRKLTCGSRNLQRKKYEREFLNTANALRHELRFFEAHLDGRLSPVRPKQAQAVEDYDNRAAFVTDHASGEVNFLCKR